MGLFYTDLMDNNSAKDFEYRRKAYQVINDKYLDYISDNEVNRYDFSRVSPKAVAMADAIRPAFINVLNEYRSKYPDIFGSDENFNSVFIPISKAITDLANGVYKGETFDADAFGIKPIDVAVSMVLKQAKAEYGLSLPRGFDEKYENEVFEAVMTPALTKLLGIMKILVAIPGLPTLFDGDDAGTTGYETKTKNMFVQCRQRNHDEWLTEGNSKYKEFLKKYNKYLDSVMKVRKNPKCNALNNGSIHTLPLNTAQSGEKISSIFRQSTDGRMAISIINPTGLHNDFRSNYRQRDIYIDKLYLDDPSGNVGISGLREGLKFVNANDESDVYYTRVENGRYYLVRNYNGVDVPTPLNDTTLILYHVPENGVPLTFTGSCMVKPQAKFVAGAYADKSCEVGKKLALIK